MRICLFDEIFGNSARSRGRELFWQQSKNKPQLFVPRENFEGTPDGVFERDKREVEKAQEELVNFIRDTDEFDPSVFRNGKDLVLDGVPWEERVMYREFLEKMKTLTVKIAGMTLPKNFWWHDVFPPKAVWDRLHKNITFLRYDETKKAIEVLILEDIRRGIEAQVRRPGFGPQKKPTPALAGYFDLLMQTLRPLQERKAALEKREAICDRIDTKIENRIDVGSEWVKLHFLLRDIQKDVEALRVSNKETPEKEEAWSKKLAEQEAKKGDVLKKLSWLYNQIFSYFAEAGSPVGDTEIIRKYDLRISKLIPPEKDIDALHLQLREISRMIEELRYYSTGQVRSLKLKTELDIADAEGELFYRWLFRVSDRGEGTYVSLHQNNKGHIEFVNESPIEDARKRIQSINALAARSPNAKSKEPVLEIHPRSDPLIRTQLEVLAAEIWRIADCDRTSMFEAGQRVFRDIDDTRSVVHLRNTISPFHIEDRILRKATIFLNLRKIREMQDLLHRMGDESFPGVSQAFRRGNPTDEMKRQKNLIEAEFGRMLNDALGILRMMEDTIVAAMGEKKFAEVFHVWRSFRESLGKEVAFIGDERKIVSIGKLEEWKKLLRETLFFFRCTLAIHLPTLRMSPIRETEIRSWRDRWDNHHVKEVRVLDIMWKMATDALFSIDLPINQLLPDHLKEGEERGKKVTIMEWVQKNIHDYFNAEAKKAGSTGPFLGDTEALPKIIKLNKILDHLQEKISCRREFIAQSLLAQNGEPQSVVDYPKKQGAVYQIYYDSSGSCFKFFVHSQDEGPGGKP